MGSKWFFDCKTEEEKKKREEFLKEQKYLFSLLKEILEKDLRSTESEMSSTKRYDDQSWPYKQADYLGTKRALQDVIDLITIGENNV